MSRNCLSGVSVDWLLLLLLQLTDLTWAVDTPYPQNDTMVCTGRQAHFRWKYKVKSFKAVVWKHKGKKIASSASLTFAPDVIISKQFKGRLTFKSEDPFSFTLVNTTIEDNGTYECIFSLANYATDSLKGDLEIQDFGFDESLLVEREKKDECVTLTCKTDPSCTWTYHNGTTEVAKEVRYCSKEANVTIKCESDHVCKFANYTKPGCGNSDSKRRRRSLDGKSSSSEDSSCNDPGTDPGTDPMNPVPIVLGVLATIIAIAVITATIVFYKRRSSEQGEQAPPVHYGPVPGGQQRM